MADEPHHPVERSVGECDRLTGVGPRVGPVPGPDRGHRRRHLPAVDGHHGCPAVTPARRREGLPAVVGQRDRDRRVGERVPRHHPVDVAELRRRLLEVFPAGRHVVEEVRHLDGGAGRTARRLDGGHLAALDDEFGAVFVPRRLARACRDGHPRDRADSVQRLPAKAERPDTALEVVDIADLTGGVFLDRAPGLRFGHPDTVVTDADPLGPAGLDSHLHPGGVGVERVLDELLDDAGGPLDHLAGRDPLDGLGVELLDPHRRLVGARGSNSCGSGVPRATVEGATAALRLFEAHTTHAPSGE